MLKSWARSQEEANVDSPSLQEVAFFLFYFLVRRHLVLVRVFLYSTDLFQPVFCYVLLVMLSRMCVSLNAGPAYNMDARDLV